MKNRNIFFTLFAVCIWLIPVPESFAVVGHNYHTSLTRMDYNAEVEAIEITIQLFTHDLSPVLEKQANKSIDLEKTNDIDKILLNYLKQNFVMKDKNMETLELVWVGKEIKVDLAFVYLEIPFEGDLDGLWMQNTIFFESFAEQTNIVVAHFNDSKADVLFKVGDKSKELKLKKNENK